LRAPGERRAARRARAARGALRGRAPGARRPPAQAGAGRGALDRGSLARVHRLLLAASLLAAAAFAAANGAASSAATPKGPQLYAHMKAVVDEETQATHLLGGSIEDTLKGACLLVRNHPDSDEAGEAQRLLADAGRDLNETIEKDVRPAVNGSGSD